MYMIAKTEYFNPFSTQFTAWEDFKNIKNVWSQVRIVTIVALVAIVTLGIGILPVFRLLVENHVIKEGVTSPSKTTQTTETKLNNALFSDTVHKEQGELLANKNLSHAVDAQPVKQEIPAPIFTDADDSDTIRKKMGEYIVLTQLPANRKLGLAIDNGDCFYDAFAQELNAEVYTKKTIKELRTTVSDTITSVPFWREYHQKIAKDENPDHIALTAQEAIEQKKPVVWGRQALEALILSEVYRVNVCIVEAGLLNEHFENDAYLQKLIKEREPLSNLRIKLEQDGQSLSEDNLKQYNALTQNIQMRYRHNYMDVRNWYPDPRIKHCDLAVHSFPKGTKYENTITLAVFNHHFYPVFEKAVNSPPSCSLDLF